MFDPYLRYVAMPYSAVHYPLGFPLQFKTNSAEVLEAAGECWGSFRQEFDPPALQMRVGVVEDGSTGCPPGPVCRAQGSVMVRIADHGNFHIADLLQGTSFVWLTSAAVAHRSYMRYHFLESAALTHIASRYTMPIHAACVELDGCGVLLCGDSGAGKSSLSFACARAGWTYVTDDASFLLQGREDRRVVGNCHMIRLRPSAEELFEEVIGKPVMSRSVGKPSIELETSTISGIVTASSSNVRYIVHLNRRDGENRGFVPCSRESTRNYVVRHLCGVEELQQNQLASVEKLLDAEAFELHFRDLDWAVDRLSRLVREKG